MNKSLEHLTDLCGQFVVQRDIKTGENWKALKLLKIEIREDGLFAILDDNFKIECNLSDFDIYIEQDGLATYAEINPDECEVE